MRASLVMLCLLLLAACRQRDADASAIKDAGDSHPPTSNVIARTWQQLKSSQQSWDVPLNVSAAPWEANQAPSTHSAPVLVKSVTVSFQCYQYDGQHGPSPLDDSAQPVQVFAVWASDPYSRVLAMQPEAPASGSWTFNGPQYVVTGFAVKTETNLQYNGSWCSLAVARVP